MISLRKKTIEDYVELVFDLQKNNEKVHTSVIANKFNINPASVTEVIQKLDVEGYVNYEKYSGTTLTAKGLKLAKQIKNKHDNITEFLILLGVNKKIAEEDACEMEHILHPSTMDIITKFVEVVQHCEVTPFWLNRLKYYVTTGKLVECPPELVKICRNSSNIKK